MWEQAMRLQVLFAVPGVRLAISQKRRRAAVELAAWKFSNAEAKFISKSQRFDPLSIPTSD
jgi:hypothetical protein